jgi:hypothetical protein
MGRTKQTARKSEAPRKQNRLALEIAWRKKKALELYPDFQPKKGFKKIGSILRFVSINSVLYQFSKCSYIINLFILSG